MTAELELTNEDCGALLLAGSLSSRELGEALIRLGLRTLDDDTLAMFAASMLAHLNDHAPEACVFHLNEDGLFLDHDFDCTLCADGVPYPHDFHIEEAA